MVECSQPQIHGEFENLNNLTRGKFELPQGGTPMPRHGTPSAIPGWYIKFQTSVLESLPRPGEISEDVATGWNDNRGALAKSFRELLAPPSGDGDDKPPFTHWIENVQTGGVIGRVNLAHLTGKSWPDGVGLIPVKFIRSAKSQTFRLAVNYDRCVEDGVKAGQYGWVNSGITQEHFPQKRTGVSAEAEVQLAHFGRDMEADEVLRDLGAIGLRPAELPELLVLGEKRPGLQREFPIVALGSRWQRSRGNCYVPCLFKRDTERALGLDRVGGKWSSVCHFLAVNK